MKYSLFHRPPVLQVLDDNSFEKPGSDVGVPDPIRVHNYDGTVAAHAEARCLTALHARRTKKQILTLQQLREERVKLAATTVG